MASKEIEAFEQMVSLDIRRTGSSKCNYKPRNLTKLEFEGLQSLAKNDSLVVKPADKGGGLVVLNREQYHHESVRLLGDPNTYQKLTNDPTNRIKEIFYEYLLRGKDRGILNDQEYRYLKVLHPRIPVFYYLPKIHKNLDNPPGRPIVSGIQSISCKISEYIDHLLQPLVMSTSAHLKDSIAILNILKDIEWEDDYILATCDVSSLYTIIPHKEGCTAVEHFVTQSGQFQMDQIQFIIEGINLILKNNYFWYGGEFYVQ
uniref:Reverse transcriptase n=1 Tax=Leptobrachium leishanense TaxID=445787 RepID=A0A8C5QWW5_9ANUR